MCLVAAGKDFVGGAAADRGQRRQHRVEHRPKLRAVGVLAGDQLARLGGEEVRVAEPFPDQQRLAVASHALAGQPRPLTLGLQPCAYLVLAQYLAGAWDDALLTCEQAFSAAAIRSRRYELPLLHLAAACVPAGRGAADEAEQHALRAEQAAASLDYGAERLYAAMARALVCQAAGDYLGMADALGPWRWRRPAAV